jgi:cytochrome c1
MQMTGEANPMLERAIFWVLFFLAFLLLAGPATARQSGGPGPHKEDPASNLTAAASLIAKYGCGACHQIPGVEGADGLVGPPLTNIGSRVYIAGVLPNTPDNLAAWIQNPQSYVPGNAMPDMGVKPDEARTIADYLSRLR